MSDWKAAIVAGVLDPEKAAPYIKRTISPQIRSRKIEASSKPLDPETAEGQAMRDRLEKASKGLVS